MNKLYKGNFLFILGFSIVFIMVLLFSSIALTKRNKTTFDSEGYILSSNKKVSFASGTQYRFNLDKNIVFNDTAGKQKEVDVTSFIHYDGGHIGLLTTGSFVDLKNMTKDLVPFYNITKKSKIMYDKSGGYTIMNGKNKLAFDDILVRISKDKYMVAGKDIQVSIPGLSKPIKGQYFEITYIADGIVLIENDEHSYQVTAQDAKIKLGDSTIDLGSKNVSKDGEILLNMSQITINGNENIDIEEEDDKKEKKKSDDESSEESASQSSAQSSQSKQSESQRQSGTESRQSQSQRESQVESTNEGGGNANVVVSTDPSIDLVSLSVGTKNVTGVFQVNNHNKLKGDLTVTITNLKTNESVTPIYSMTSTGYLSVYADGLATNSDYSLSIKGKSSGNVEVEYFQRTFATEDYNLSLKKVMVSDSEIDYRVIFGEDSKVISATVGLYDKSGAQIGDLKTVTKSSNDALFTNLTANTPYTIKVTNFKVGNVTYVSEGITKDVLTLKKTPTIGAANIATDDNTSKIIMNLEDITDSSSIVNYVFKVYKYDANGENGKGALIGKINSTSPSAKVNIGSSEEVEDGIVKTVDHGSNYVYQATVEYNDNEKVREVLSPVSGNFFVGNAIVTFTYNEAQSSFNKKVGTVKLVDQYCSVPMSGRTACDLENSFIISYSGGGIQGTQEITLVETEESGVYTGNFEITGLRANTEYGIELRGDVYIPDDNKNPVLHLKTQIGNKGSFRTEGISSIRIEAGKKGVSDDSIPISRNVQLKSNSQDANYIDNVKYMKMTLYALDVANEKHLIKEPVILDSTAIKSFYNQDKLITNADFGIENMDVLVDTIKDYSGWAYENYVIVFSDAYDAPFEADGSNYGNSIPIEDPEVKVSIDKAYLLDYYARQTEATSAKINVIRNGESEKHFDDLQSNTEVGYTIVADVPIENALRQYYGITGSDVNWNYNYYIYNKKGEQVYSVTNSKSKQQTFYLKYLDEGIDGFERGNKYTFGFQIVTNDTVYPTEILKPLRKLDGSEEYVDYVTPKKQNPTIAFAIWNSGVDNMAITYKITKDVDNAFYDNNLYLYDGTTKISSAPITKGQDFQSTTFNGLTGGKVYGVKYNQADNTKDEGEAFSVIQIGNIIFPGKYNLASTYTLNYSDIGNNLGIIINDDTMLARGAVYNISVTKEGTNDSKTFIYKMEDLVTCDEGTKKNCLIIDYADLEEFIGANSTVDVVAYYENGVTGLNVESDYYVMKSAAETNYLQVNKSGAVKPGMPTPGGVYLLDKEQNKFKIKNALDGNQFVDTNEEKPLDYIIDVGAVRITGIPAAETSYNPKKIVTLDMNSDDKNFFFSGIVPSADTKVTRKINSLKLGIDLYGLTENIVKNEFKSDDRKVTVELYEDDTYTNPVSVSSEIDINNLNDTLYFEFNDLKPNTVYYYKIFANINSKNGYKKTELYDFKSDGSLVIDKKSAKTLDKDEILRNVDTTFKSIGYNVDRLGTIKTYLKDSDGYTLKYEIVDNETNNKIPLKASRDASEVSNTFTPAENGDDVFANLDEDFVFNKEGGYTLTITAVTNDSNKYELELYSEDFIPHKEGNVNQKELEAPRIKAEDVEVYLAPIGDGKKSYSAKFVAAVRDEDFVLVDNEYYIKFVDSIDNTIVFSPEGYTLESDGSVKIVGNPEGINNPMLVYNNLEHLSDYSIIFIANVKMNNKEKMTEPQQLPSPPSSVSTSNMFNIDIGEGVLSIDEENNKIVITYDNKTRNLGELDSITVNAKVNDVKIIQDSYSPSGIVSNVDGTYTVTLDPGATVLKPNDRVWVSIRYTATDLNGHSGNVGSGTYVNYEND